MRPGPCALRLTRACRWQLSNLSLDSNFMPSRLSAAHGSLRCQWKSSLWTSTQARNLERSLPRCVCLSAPRICDRPDVDIRRLRLVLGFRKRIPFSTSSQQDDSNRYSIILSLAPRMECLYLFRWIMSHFVSASRLSRDRTLLSTS